MKKIITSGIFCFSLLMSSVNIVFAQATIESTDSTDTYIYDRQAPHGGKLKATGVYIVEMAQTFEKMTVYLYNKDLLPYKNIGITGSVTYRQNDGTFLSSDLVPVEETGFSPKMYNSNYALCSVYLYVYGKKVAAHFSNTDNLVKKPSVKKTETPQ